MKNWIFNAFFILILIGNVTFGSVPTFLLIVAMFVLCQVDARMDVAELERLVDKVLAKESSTQGVSDGLE